MTLTSPAQTAVVQALPLAKDLDENKVTPGILGFVVFAVMGIAVWMLMKSMHRHMQKVDFEEAPPGADAGGAQGAAGTGGREASSVTRAEGATSGASGSSGAASGAPSSSASRNTSRDAKGSGPGV
ncbi:hypothetical protein [Streptomyces marispadix]|uniref:Uncharacterized protein n=1 Tax=Streptomyces marispadix TaxID=2922868 RepID=A0ABS9T168_9ACTN|nr:hypothetical protein [Streptomyces marispadix]MCH6162275.1 hypothetical protein [Streptomyces marispadix]